MPLVCSCGAFFRCAAAGEHRARVRRAPRPWPGLQFAPGNRARLGSAAHHPRRPAGSRRAPGRSWAAGRCHGACSSRPSVPPSAPARYGQTRTAGGPGRDHPRDGHSQGPLPGPPRAAASPADPDHAARTGGLPAVPVKPGARPPGHAHQSGDVRPIIGGLAERQPERGAGCFPRVRSVRRTGRPAIRRRRMRPGGLDRAAGSFIEPGPVTGIVRGGSGDDLAGQEACACPFRPIVASSHVDGRGLAGHGSASRSMCLPAWSSPERRVRVGSGGVYAASRSMAVR